MRDFYKQGVQRGGLIIGGVPKHSEHGRVYAGKITVFVSHNHNFKDTSEFPNVAYVLFSIFILQISQTTKENLIKAHYDDFCSHQD